VCGLRVLIIGPIAAVVIAAVVSVRDDALLGSVTAGDEA
jgi:hypothetical protein